MSCEPVNDCNCVIEDLLQTPFVGRSYINKLDLISKGKPTPLIPDLVSVTKKFTRHFKTQHYESTPWLSGCTKFRKLFCWPCLLFSTERNVWTTGYADLNNLQNTQKRHECTITHIVSCISLKQFGKTRIEFGLSEQFQINKEKHNELVSRNRRVLSRLIDATCFLAENGLSFRGDESRESVNQGNYVELVQLMRNIDKEFDSYLQNTTVFTDLSSDIQNNLIQCISQVVLLEIKKEINDAPFVAVILDETTDASNKCQVSTLLRYVNNEAEVQERFLGYEEFSGDRSTSALTQHVFKILNEYECEHKLIAQTYDGFATMSGEHRGLQTQVKERHGQALFVHCYAHRMMLVLKNSVDHIKECKVFFMTLSGLCSYFSKSSKRTSVLHQEMEKRFPSVAPKRWNYNSKLVCTVVEQQNELKRLFSSIIDHRHEWDMESYNGAVVFLPALQDFDFNFMLKLFSSVLPQADMIFDIFQRKMSNIDYCLKQLDHFGSFLSEMRNSFDTFWSEVEAQCSPEENHNKRIKIEDVSSERKGEYRKLFYEVIDTIKSKLEERFADVNRLNFLTLLDSSKFKQFSSAFPDQQYESLKMCYGQYFEIPLLRTELITVYSDLQFYRGSTYQLLKYLHNVDLSDVLPQVYILASLIETFPITSASSERLFSILKSVKTYLRNSQKDERLSSLALLSTEKVLLTSLKRGPNFHNKVIDLFAEKSRRIELLFKS